MKHQEDLAVEAQAAQAQEDLAVEAQAREDLAVAAQAQEDLAVEMKNANS